MQNPPYFELLPPSDHKLQRRWQVLVVVVFFIIPGPVSVVVEVDEVVARWMPVAGCWMLWVGGGGCVSRYSLRCGGSSWGSGLAVGLIACRDTIGRSWSMESGLWMGKMEKKRVAERYTMRFFPGKRLGLRYLGRSGRQVLPPDLSSLAPG